MCIFINLGWEIFCRKTWIKNQNEKYRYILLHSTVHVKGKQLLHAKEQQTKKALLETGWLQNSWWILKTINKHWTAQFNIEKIPE